MEHFTPLTSLLGGMLIGLSSACVYLFHGRIAGVSSLLGGALRGAKADRAWRTSFLLGLLAAGLLAVQFFPDAFAVTIKRPPMVLALAGLLVGLGTQVGKGCTSGHGVCGIGRLSKRSLIATLSFMISGMLTVFVYTRLLESNLR
ncbi:MAG: YeeE/YedE family protein [Myxococcales bacterium]|nr:MAG: YeeE/YedE family protein [Myxococcales bacterium]